MKSWLHEVARRTVQALQFFTKQTNELDRPWHGRVWLSPPYLQAALATRERSAVERTGKLLPRGLLEQLESETGKGRRELQFRMQFAERFVSEEELCNAIAQFKSWHEITNHILADRPFDQGMRDIFSRWLGFNSAIGPMTYRLVVLLKRKLGRCTVLTKSFSGTPALTPNPNARLVALLKERMRRCGLPCDDGGDGPSRAHHHRTIIEVLRARFQKPKATDNTE